MAPYVIRAARVIRVSVLDGGVSYAHVIKFLADASAETAQAMELQDAVDFGRERGSRETSVTSVARNGKYARYVTALREFARAGVADAGVWRRRVGDDATTEVIASSTGAEIRASTFVAWPECVNEPIGDVLLFHPNTASTVNVRTKQHHDFANFVLSPSARCDEIARAAARIQWREMQLTGFARGSQGIADALLKAMLLARGLGIWGWRANVSPDLEAFIRTSARYQWRLPCLIECL